MIRANIIIKTELTLINIYEKQVSVRSRAKKVQLNG